MAPYLGLGDLETHLKAFEAQMLISDGFNIFRYKMFVGTLTRTTLQWFNKIIDGMIDSFRTFSQLFLQQFTMNQVKPQKLANLFDVHHKEGESLCGFLNQFC